MGAAALYAGLAGQEGCDTLTSWGCDCTGCDCTDALDLGAIAEVPSDYADGCAADYNGFSCDEMAYFGFNCHYMETRRMADCSGCMCEETVLGFEKGDGSCTHSCVGSSCDTQQASFPYSCGFLETLDFVGGCDCSGCACEQDGGDHPGLVYNGMDCNGNGFWVEDLGDETCGDEVASLTYIMGNPDDGYEERTWFMCLNCPELDCDMADCGDSCARGDTCALPLSDLCADEVTAHTPTPYGRSVYCADGWDATEEATEAASVEATDATVAADEDGSFTLATTAVFAITFMFA